MYLLVLVSLLGVLYLYLKYHYNHWRRLKVPGPDGEFIFGNIRDVVMLKKNIGQQLDKIYNDYKDCDFVGFYKFLKPAILLRSPQLIHKVFVEDFDHFQSNDFSVGAHDEITSRNPFMVSGAQWRKTRNAITPAFTSGKLKSMVPLTIKASDNMIDFINSNVALNSAGGFDARDLSLRFTTDNTASVAFGLEANSFDKNDCTFLNMAQKIFNLSFLVSIKLMMFLTMPDLVKLLKIKIFESSVEDFFRNVVNKTLQHRKDTGVGRNDILNQFVELRKKLGDQEFGEIDILSQSILIIANGAEASSATMGFMLFLLATNLKIQEKVQKEIDTILKKHNNEISYETIKDMQYLDQILNESLRLYPATLVNMKLCTKSYTIPKTEFTPALTIEPGTPVMVGVRAINVDEKYFLNPEKFDPERFSPENAEAFPKNVFLPFGDGPRICLGQRYAIIQMKIGMIRILKDFDITLNKNTVLPVKLSPRLFLSRSVNPMFVNFQKRQKKY